MRSSLRKPLPCQGLTRQAGLSLVELMVAMAISLMLVAAAAYVYVGTRQAQRAIDDVAAANDAGAFALQLIGREVMNAGFYPAIQSENPAQVLGAGQYKNLVVGAPAAYDYGLFGCEGGQFDPVTRSCPAGNDAQPDSIVISFFTGDAFGPDAGQSYDCTGKSVRTADDTAVNDATRIGSGSAYQQPFLPLFISNRYGLMPTTMRIEGQDVETGSLGCNGNASGSGDYLNVLSGIEDLQITYGVKSTDPLAVSPQSFLTASQVSALPVATIDGVQVKGWGRVVAVRVCVVAQSLTTGSKLAETATAGRTFIDCNGREQNQAASDTRVRKSYTQVFGVRNRQNMTY